ncbi:protein-S-isoprenylcysteine O-methyltransferase [Siccirubricoccus phaeus]|uniref:protein-S-isoprenylcysteine O-methyltransferase n=1 Tax=Siccirubricoccus phaeus TaxID=2595053 RepID=UPI001A9C727E|nr:protein-S-isoprenylcysteine O-methyltransferase [Siccirubricoccus phaeus]
MATVPATVSWRLPGFAPVLAIACGALYVLRGKADWAALAWLAGFVASSLIRARRTPGWRDNRIDDRRDVGEERILLALAFLGMMALPLLWLATPLLDWAARPRSAAAAWLGVALLPPYLWLFHRSHADLGRNWSPTLELRDSHRLVTAGVYARIRHPMYAAIWLGTLAQMLLLPNYVVGPAGALAFAIMYARRVPHEEAMMRARFGDAYDRYTARTGRLLPRFCAAPDR